MSPEPQTIAERLAGRVADPSLRPEGARFARVVAVANSDPLGAGAERGR